MQRIWFKPYRFWKVFAAYYPATLPGWIFTGVLCAIGVIAYFVLHAVQEFLLTLISLGLLFDLACARLGEYPAWWKRRA